MSLVSTRLREPTGVDQVRDVQHEGVQQHLVNMHIILVAADVETLLDLIEIVLVLILDAVRYQVL